MCGKRDVRDRPFDRQSGCGDRSALRRARVQRDVPLEVGLFGVVVVGGLLEGCLDVDALVDDDDVQIHQVISELKKLIGEDASKACLEKRSLLIEARMQELVGVVAPPTVHKDRDKRGKRGKGP